MRTWTFRVLVPAAAAVSAFVAAGPARAADPKPAAVPEAAMKEAKEIFASRCAVCHGASGKGDGPGAAALTPKPRDYTDKAWQKTIADDYLEKVIVGGGPAVGKSPMMPPNPDLASKPDVVKGIRTIIRDFAK